MNRLDQLRPSILDMDIETLREHVRRIRADRKLTKERPAKKRAAARTTDKNKSAMMKLLDGMTPEEIEALLGTGENVGSTGNTSNTDQGEEPSTN